MAWAPLVSGAAPEYRRERSPVRGGHQLRQSTIRTSAPIACPSRFSRTELQWLQGAGGAKHHNGGGFLVFRCSTHLILCQFKRDAVALAGDASEMQRIPVDHDFPAADAEKAAEIDHGRAHRTGTIDDHVDDVPHILIRRT